MMKRIISLLIAVTCLCGGAFAADFDLSGLSYDELVSLKEQVDFAIWNSNEWQEVEVPQGVWVIGEDIPEGKWTIKAAEGVSASISWGDVLDSSGLEISYEGDIYAYDRVESESYHGYDFGDTLEVTWDMKAGEYFVVEDGVAVFSPYSGKPKLGFK